jgi:hypothetical protein
MFGKKLAVPTKTVPGDPFDMYSHYLYCFIGVYIYIYNIYIYILCRYKKKQTSDPQLKDYRARTLPPAFLISCSGRFHV